MKIVRRWLLPFALLTTLTVASAATPPKDAKEKEVKRSRWVFSLLPKSFQKNPLVDLTVITEMTEAGKTISPPTEDRPTYVLFQSGGNHNQGQGVLDKKMPSAESVAKVVEGALGSAYYLPSSSEHPPSLVVIYIWGIFNNLDAGDDLTPGFDDVGHKNLLGKAAMVGGTKFAAELAEVLSKQDDADDAAQMNADAQRHMAEVGISMPAMPVPGPLAMWAQRDEKTELLMQQALGNCYFIVASAYDYPSLAKNERKLLWRTKITANADGIALAETVPLLARSGTSYFGRETNGAAVLDRRLDRTGKVEIGTATVKGYEAPTTEKKAK